MRIDLNKNQRRLTYIAIGAFIISVSFAPWETARKEPYLESITQTTSPIWSPPFTIGSETTRLRIDSLLLEWVAIGIVYAGLFVMFKASADRQSQIPIPEAPKAKSPPFDKTKIFCWFAVSVLVFGLIKANFFDHPVWQTIPKFDPNQPYEVIHDAQPTIPTNH